MKQTAQALDLTLSAAKTRLQRARMKLRESLRDYHWPTRASRKQGSCTEWCSETVSLNTVQLSRERAYRSG